VAATDMSPTPYFPATFGPDGEMDAATAMSNLEYGRICSRPSSTVNQSVFAVTTSPRNSRMMTSKLSSIIRRC
jgi:hypothetical protein